MVANTVFMSVSVSSEDFYIEKTELLWTRNKTQLTNAMTSAVSRGQTP